MELHQTGNAKPTSTARRKLRVLVVDDDPAILRLLKVYLHRADLEVLTAETAVDALRLISQGTTLDCVITDAILPSINGFELVRAIRAHERELRIPILMLTRKAERESIQRALEAGADDYIVKPIDESVLLDKINQSLHRYDRPKQTVSLALSGTPEASCSIVLEAELVSISETDFWIRLPFTGNATRTNLGTLELPILKKLGIELPRLRLQGSRPGPGGQGIDLQYCWIGLPESQLQKLRAFIQREQIRRRN